MAELSEEGCAAAQVGRDDDSVSGGGLFTGEPACRPRESGDRDIVDIEALEPRELKPRRRLCASRQNKHRFPEVGI
jgi:hypothetical protein